MNHTHEESPAPRRSARSGGGRRFRPSLPGSCLGAGVFCTGALAAVATPWGQCLPAAVVWPLYALAALFLGAAVWALALWCRQASPVHRVRRLAHRHPLSARLWEDDSFRLLLAGCGALAGNSLLALSKLLAAWWFSSRWLMALAGYHLVLCLTRFLMLRSSRPGTARRPGESPAARQWRPYRLCGCLLVVLSFALQGVAVLIVREGQSFRYDGYLIFAVAFYDFYCLISSLVFLITRRRSHTPVILALRQISLATSLVSMLSLQTAMLAAFGGETAPRTRQWMNLLTGTAVCVLLAALGVSMILTAHRKSRG